MAISRVQKYKEYRDSLIKEEAPDLETPKSSSKSDYKHEDTDTTSTLPLDQVIADLNEEEDSVLVKKQRNRTILKYVLIGLGALLVIAALVVFGILVWGK